MLLTRWSLKKITTHVYAEMSHWRRVIGPDRHGEEQQWSLTAQQICRTSAQHHQDHLCLLASGMCLCVKWWSLMVGIVHLKALKNVIAAVGRVPGVLGILISTII